MSDCPSCGNAAIRVDVVSVDPVSDDEIDTIPDDAVDMCLSLHGFQTTTPVGGAIVAWHDHEVGSDSCPECGSGDYSEHEKYCWKCDDCGNQWTGAEYR